MKGATVSVSVLGTIAVAVDGEPVPIPRAQWRAVLARLALSVNEVVPADRLIDDIWGEGAPPAARASLRACVSHLRRLLGGGSEVVATRPPGYLLCLPVDQLDRGRFETLTLEGRRLTTVDPAAAVATLGPALECWRGDPYGELVDEPWARADAARLLELREAAVDARFDARLALGEHDVLVGELEAAVAAQPLREHRVGQLVLALHRGGRSAEALRAFQRHRATLGEEIGLEPASELVRLDAAIAVQDPGLDWQAPQPQPGIGPLPEAATVFVGRGAELEAVAAAVEPGRIVTLVGPPGAGKTRLALEAAQVAGAGGMPVHLAELAPVGAAAVGDTIAAALGVRPAAGRPPIETAAAAWRSRDALLVVDGCEHVLDEVAPMLEQLSGRAGGLRVVATSREPLGSPHERVIAVGALPLPPDGDEGVDLFLDRAARAGWTPASDDDRLAAAALCRKLDGLPLAIELAAATAPVVAPADLVDRVETQLGLLSVSRGESRHRTLEAAIAWSDDLLGADARDVLRDLAVFAGRFTLPAAEAVARRGASPAAVALAALVRSSLVSVDVSRGRHGYRLLGGVRALAAAHSHASALDDAADRHLRFVASFADDARGGLNGPDQGRWLEECEWWVDDVRRAARRAIERHDPAAARIVSGLARFWSMRGLAAEGAALLGEAIAAAAGGDATEPDVVMARAGLLFEVGRLDDAAALCEEGMAVAAAAGNLGAVALGRIGIGQIATARGDNRGALDHLTVAVAEARRASRPEVLLHGLSTLGQVQRFVGDTAEGLASLGEAESLAREVGDLRHLVVALNASGSVRAIRQELDAARAALDEALEVARGIGYRQGEAIALGGLALVAGSSGDPDAAGGFYEDSIAIGRSIGDRRLLMISLYNLAVLRLTQGRADAARGPAGEALLAARQIGAEQLAVQALNLLGEIADAAADAAAARVLHRDALAGARRLGRPRVLAECAEGAASALVEDSPITAGRLLEHARAIRLLQDEPIDPQQARLVDKVEARVTAALGGTPLPADIDLPLEEVLEAALVALSAGTDDSVIAVRTPAPIEVRDRAVVAVLGDAAVTTVAGGARIPLTDDDEGRLLALLVTLRGRSASRPDLARSLWPEDPAAAERTSAAVVRVRRLLDPESARPAGWYVVGDAGGVRLDLEHITVDVEDVLDRAARGLALAAAEDTSAEKFLSTAARAAGSPVLGRWYAQPWALAFAAQVRSITTDAVRALGAISARGDDMAQAASWLALLVELDPYDEDAHLALIDALLGADRPDDAAVAHRRYAEMLCRLGLGPSPMVTVAAN